jgi:hypothetical protein
MFRPLSPERSTWKSFSEQKKQSMNGPAQEPTYTAVELLEKEYPTIYNGYKQIMEEQFELFAKKHLDYGMSNISAGTQLANPDEVAFALTGLWYRVSDKVSRWKNLIINKRGSQNEPLSDTYKDIANYGIIAQLVERGLWKK